MTDCNHEDKTGWPSIGWHSDEFDNHLCLVNCPTCHTTLSREQVTRIYHPQPGPLTRIVRRQRPEPEELRQCA